MTGEEILGACLRRFAYEDRSNAAIHLGEVRYSPLTFELARMIDASFDVSLLDNETRALVWDVRDHDGKYPRDGGRSDG